MAVAEPEAFASMLQSSKLAAVVKYTGDKQRSKSPLFDSASLPTVLAHGMGDSCFNGGMSEITKDVGKHIGTYSVCVPTGDNWLSDTINGFYCKWTSRLMFAGKIRRPQLKNGFNAIGFSQGNSLIRGYIQKYNDPPVKLCIACSRQ